MAIEQAMDMEASNEDKELDVKAQREKEREVGRPPLVGAQPAILAALTAAADEATTPYTSEGGSFAEALERVIEDWMEAPVAEVGVPYVGPRFIRWKRERSRYGSVRVTYVPRGIVYVLLSEESETNAHDRLRVALDEFGDVTRMTPEEIRHRVAVVRAEYTLRYGEWDHSRALLATDGRWGAEQQAEAKHWLEGWDIATHVADARALLNGGDGQNGHQPQPTEHP
jgi:hypothetical protein